MLSIVSENRYKYQSLVNFAGRYIYPDTKHEDVEYSEICSKQIDISMRRFVIKTLLLLAAGYAAVSGPVYAYIVDGTLTSTTDLRIPFTETGSNVEFMINMFFQFNIYIHGGSMYIGVEVLVSIIEDIAALQPNLVQFELNNLIEEQKLKKLSEHHVCVHFKNIVKQVLDTEM